MPDQLVDRTKTRTQTFFDGLPLPDGTVPNVVHVSLADPYCPVGRKAGRPSKRRAGVTGSRWTAARSW